MKSLIIALTLLAGVSVYASPLDGTYQCRGGQTITIAGQIAFSNGNRYRFGMAPTRNNSAVIITLNDGQGPQVCYPQRK